jgi:methylated-DNA-[protein]-cysteine S-methyltransferase
MPQVSLHAPFADLTLAEEDGAIVSLDWGWVAAQQETPLLRRAVVALHAYFDGTPLPDLPLNPAGTPYQRRVWQALCTIPYGQTRTYAEIAALAGGVARTVGQANARNPIPILIPCHRVVAGNGIGGYSAEGGVETKRQLLRLEGVRA